MVCRATNGNPTKSHPRSWNLVGKNVQTSCTLLEVLVGFLSRETEGARWRTPSPRRVSVRACGLPTGLWGCFPVTAFTFLISPYHLTFLTASAACLCTRCVCVCVCVVGLIFFGVFFHGMQMAAISPSLPSMLTAAVLSTTSSVSVEGVGTR
jgi:hypothetical protein